MAPRIPTGTDRQKRRIFFVDDHPITREGFGQLINYQSDLHMCGEGGTVADALAAIPAAKPDLLIVDISLGDGNGVDLIKAILTRQPGLPILVLSTHDESLYAERALRAGAKGYVMKQSPTSEVMKAIREVLSGQIYLSTAMQTKLIHKHLHGHLPGQNADTDALSDRELEVFQMIGSGRTTRQIAADIHLSVSTVETYRAHIKEKLELRNAMELVRAAVEWVHAQQE